MKNMRTSAEILDEIFLERNSSLNTQRSYVKAVNKFEIYFDKPLAEIMDIVEKEEDMGIPWRKSTIRAYLIEFRRYLYNIYKSKTAKLYLTLVMSVFKHYEFVIQQLPRFSEDIEILPILPEDIPDRDMLQECIDVSSLLIESFVLLAISTGMSRKDLLNLKVFDYLKATEEYHNHLEDVYGAIKEMNNSKIDIIPVFKNLIRQKTKLPYFTFGSPEAAKSINNYLISRRVLICDENGKVIGARDVLPSDPLFDVAYQTIGDMFQSINDKLGLGKAGRYNRFTPHMLRKYHATQLHKAGMSEEKINLLEGRTPKSIIHQSYIRVSVDDLKEEYIKALPYIVVNEIEKVRTKLDVAIEKNEKLEVEISEKTEKLDKYKEIFNNLDERIKNLEEKRDEKFKVDEFF